MTEQEREKNLRIPALALPGLFLFAFIFKDQTETGHLYDSPKFA